MQTGLIAIVILIAMGLVYSLVMCKREIDVLRVALEQEQEETLALREARLADLRAMEKMLEAEQEARHAVEERQKYIDTIHGALNGTGLLDALRMFGEAVCEYDPTARRVTCTDTTSGSTRGAEKRKDGAGVDGSGGKAD